MDKPATERVPRGQQAASPPWAARATALRELAATWIRFSLVGTLKTVLDFGVFNLVLFLSPVTSVTIVLLANTAGFSVAVASSFLLNARFTFRMSAGRNGFARYVAISLVGLAVYNGALAAVLALWQPEGTLAINAAKIMAVAVSMAFNFVGYRTFVFNGSHTTHG